MCSTSTGGSPGGVPGLGGLGFSLVVSVGCVCLCVWCPVCLCGRVCKSLLSYDLSNHLSVFGIFGMLESFLIP